MSVVPLEITEAAIQKFEERKSKCSSVHWSRGQWPVAHGLYASQKEILSGMESQRGSSNQWQWWVMQSGASQICSSSLPKDQAVSAQPAVAERLLTPALKPKRFEGKALLCSTVSFVHLTVLWHQSNSLFRQWGSTYTADFSCISGILLTRPKVQLDSVLCVQSNLFCFLYEVVSCQSCLSGSFTQQQQRRQIIHSHILNTWRGSRTVRVEGAVAPGIT